MGRRVVRWRVKFDLCVEPATIGHRLLVGADSHSADCHRCGRRDHSICSKTLERIILITWFLRLADARLDLYDVKNSLLCASESVLRVIGHHAALFLWRARLGNIDTGK